MTSIRSLRKQLGYHLKSDLAEKLGVSVDLVRKLIQWKVLDPPTHRLFEYSSLFYTTNEVAEIEKNWAATLEKGRRQRADKANANAVYSVAKAKGLVTKRDIMRATGFTTCPYEYLIEIGVVPEPTHNHGSMLHAFYTEEEAQAIIDKINSHDKGSRWTDEEKNGTKANKQSKTKAQRQQTKAKSRPARVQTRRQQTPKLAKRKR